MTKGEGEGFRFILNKDYLIVEIEELDTSTASGLYVGNVGFAKGTVVCAGKGVFTPYGFIENLFKVGDKVLLDRATLEGGMVRSIPQYLYQDSLDGKKVIDFEVAAYLISSDMVLGKWEKREGEQG